MRCEKLESMKGGWFIGAFNPSLRSTNDFEVAVKRYSAGDHEPAHYHKIATEFTVIVSGEVAMNDDRFQSGDIVVVEPEERVAFRAITDATITVVKIPSAPNDKYIQS